MKQDYPCDRQHSKRESQGVFFPSTPWGVQNHPVLHFSSYFLRLPHIDLFFSLSFQSSFNCPYWKKKLELSFQPQDNPAFQVYYMLRLILLFLKTLWLEPLIFMFQLWPFFFSHATEPTLRGFLFMVLLCWGHYFLDPMTSISSIPFFAGLKRNHNYFFQKKR